MNKTVQVPDGWKPAKLKDAAQVNPRSNSVDDDSLVTFLPMTAVSESGIIQGAEIRKAIDVKKGFTSFETGDVLVAKITPCFENNKGCLCRELKNDRGYGSTEFHVLRPKKNIMGEYLHILTRTHHFRGTGELNMTGTAGQKRVPTIFLKNYDFHLPPLPEQKAIADLLSTWDDAIEKTERLIRAKEANLRAHIQILISLRCNSWLHIKTINMFDTITEKNFPEEELLSVTQDHGVIPRDMLEGRVMSPEGTTASYKLIKQGDFAISLRSFQGGIEYSNYQGIISPAYTVVRPKIELNSDFYRLFFKSKLFIEKYLTLAVIGIRDGKQISIPDFLSIKIPVPPLKEQEEIAEALTTLHHEIDLLKQLAAKYKTQKRGLMQKMLTGAWRIKPEIVNQYMEKAK
ncbi:restriction endonuclease subunit S [Oligosphaera ethanolica]|uniref:Type I restriction enzyme S subunit n=1 Tax=Oligosphaera ethanolica TaxID=760260 RepID=A0AAE3VE16_9BACT|nr:restriction endonuclease subunit S [Oligosphaera ethanolica]MDQ0288578.1 type I restriction enzyme S subunit [Oligosphaera ethanolica]